MRGDMCTITQSLLGESAVIRILPKGSYLKYETIHFMHV